MYGLKDISVIIPTYNRADDLRETLDSFSETMPLLQEVVLIDQSTDQRARTKIAKMANKKIKYFYSAVPSLTKARNFGVQKSSNKSKIVLFLDDDVTLDQEYFNEILKVFNTRKEARGATGYYFPKERAMSGVEKRLRRLFLIEHVWHNCADVLSAYGAVYPDKLTQTIRAMWMPGFNMAFKKEVFSELQFDERLARYALAEDFDFTYRLYKKYPGSLFMTPTAKLVHRVSALERYPTEKVSYMNQVHHVYLNFKNFNRGFEKIKFVWCLIGISILRIIQLAKTRDKKDYLKMKYYFASLFYSLSNIQRIKNGDLHLPEFT